MINLRNDNTNAMIGAISETDLAMLIETATPEPASEQTLIINAATVAKISDGGKATVHMLGMLRAAVGTTDGLAVRWKRS